MAEEQRPSEGKDNKKIEKVVEGIVKKKKKSGFSKFTDAFLEGDGQSIWTHVTQEIIIPSIKKAIYQTASDGISMLLFGNTSQTGSRLSSPGSKISYNRFYEDRRDDRVYATRTRTPYDYDDIILETKSDAERVIDTMNDILDQYRVVSVADFYELVDERTVPNDNKYGWTNLRNAYIERVRDGYLIRLPRPIPID